MSSPLNAFKIDLKCLHIAYCSYSFKYLETNICPFILFENYKILEYHFGTTIFFKNWTKIGFLDSLIVAYMIYHTHFLNVFQYFWKVTLSRPSYHAFIYVWRLKNMYVRLWFDCIKLEYYRCFWRNKRSL